MSPADQIRLLRLHAPSGQLEVEWEDGATAALPYAVVRERCPRAECRQRRRTGDLPGAAEDITVLGALPCGPNAVQLRFSDGHDRGIFPFPYLRELRDELAAPQR